MAKEPLKLCSICKKPSRGKCCSRSALYGRRWRNAKARIFAEEPLCRDCKLLHNRIRLAEEMHHSIKHYGKAEIFWKDPKSNWVPLCKECHQARTLNNE